MKIHLDIHQPYWFNNTYIVWVGTITTYLTISDV